MTQAKSAKIIWAEKIKQLLSSRKTGYIIIAVIILCRVLQQLYFFNTRNDMTYQILGAQYLLDGHGISTASIVSSDLSHIIYQPINQWPPGFSILFIPFYFLLGKNYIAAALALGIACAILLVFFGRAILKLLEVPYYLVNLYSLLSGFFGYYFYTKPCTDAVGITFLLIAVYYALLIIKKNNFSVKNTLLLTLTLILSGFIKYLFIPLAFIIPAYLIVKGLGDKKKSLSKTGLIVLVSLIVLFGSFLLFQKTTSGTVGYVKQPERGFYPENLKSTFPFITGSFIKPDTVEQLLPGQTKANALLFRSFQIISLAIFAFLLFYFLKRIRKNKLQKTALHDDLFSISTLASFLIAAILIFLSLRVAKEPLDFGQFWTYVEEPRYYGLINVLLHIGVFALYYLYKSAKGRYLRLLFPLLLFLMIPEMFRGVVFTSNRLLKIKNEKYGWQYEQDFQKKGDSIIETVKKRQSPKKIILTGTSDWMTLRVSLYSRLPFFTEVEKLLSIPELKTSEPITLIAIIREDYQNKFKPFVSSPDVRPEGSGYGFFFYSFDLKP
ncbi:MAG: hypothetical protein HZB42_13470 [Sphingobacteriales bacterium]|nr:hypothetical protein [Sphingobacteriales bacterium]